MVLSAVKRGLISGYKRKRAAENLRAVNADCAAAKKTDGTSSGSCKKGVHIN